MATHTPPNQSVLARILDWIRNRLHQLSLTGRRAAGSGEPDALSPDDATMALSQLMDSETIRDLLTKLRAAGITPTGSMIQMVHLTEAQREFGEQWPEIADMAMSVAEMLLRDRLGQSDIYSKYQHHGFVVVFTELNPEMADKRARALSHEISQLLLKKSELREAIRTRQVTKPVGEGDGTWDIDVDRSNAAEARPQGQDEGAKNAARSGSADAAGTDGAGAAGASEGTSEPPSEGSNHPSHEQLSAGATTRASAQRGKQNSLDKGLAAMYRPMLLVPKRVVAINVAVPRRRAQDGEWMSGQAAYTPGEGGYHNLSMDRFVCDHVVADLRRTAQADSPSIFAAMMRIDSLKSSSKFMETFGQLAAAERNRLILEIVALSPNTPVSKIQEIFGRYRRITKHLVLQVAPTNTQFGQFAAVGIGAVSCYLDEGADEGGSNKRNVELVDAFGTGARAAGVRCHVHGVDDPETYAAAVAAGVQNIAGGVIGALVERSFAPYPFRPDTAASNAA